ncbi:MAG TPA: transglycosylase domain-containing protein [Solirubrobacteraceae bacterium]|jgi:penicillin-binding protein 1A|nr:transglycosylase domain-containing protein [Solirubrobacteraceae bacterium]
MRRKDPARAILIAGGAILAALVVIGVIGVAVVAAIAAKVPPIRDLHQINEGNASVVYYSDGATAGLIKSTVLRQPIASTQMPHYLREATVAIEDQRFWTTGAIDPLSLLRAAVTDVTAGRTLQGGSTITMQLVRNLYLPDNRSFTFKVKEAVIAERLEQVHSKLWILKTYLNSVPYGTVDGQTAEGVEAASWIFFDHAAKDDDLAESALLAGLPQAPSDYNPFSYPGPARQRRNIVLAKMEQLGEISQAQADAAESAPLGLRPNSHYALGGSYLLDYIRQELISHYGPSVIADGGLKVYTTVNPHLSALARHAITSVLNLPTDPSAALVSENPANGYVDAIAQSGSYAQSQYNLATQAQRQPGSTFKAIVLADALAHGIDPFTTTYLSHTLQPGWLPSAPTYQVEIDGGGSLNAFLTLDQALVASDNTVFAQLAADLTEASVTKMAYAMGVTTHLDSYPAEALGGLTYGVTPLEMANVYATIADGGYRNKQITIRKVVFPDGRVDSSWGVPHRTRVLSTPATLVETEILQHNVQYGTATQSAIACPSAAKTGTTSKLVDAWLDGFTPTRATDVWMGYQKANISMNDVHGQAQFGGDLPADIWHDFMSQAITPPCSQFTPPTADPMTYLPFSGVYQRQGAAAYVAPKSTGATGSSGAGIGGHGTGGAAAPTTGNSPAKPQTNTTPPASNPGGAQAPPGTSNAPLQRG